MAIASLLLNQLGKKAARKLTSNILKSANRSKSFRTAQNAINEVAKFNDLGDMFSPRGIRKLEDFSKHFNLPKINLDEMINEIVKESGSAANAVDMGRYLTDTIRQIQQKAKGLKPKKLITGNIDKYFKEQEESARQQNVEEAFEALSVRIYNPRGTDHQITCINSVSFKLYRNAMKKLVRFLRIDELYLFAENPEEVDKILEDVDIPGSIIFIFNTAKFQNGNLYRHPEIVYDRAGRGNFVDSPNRFYNQDMVKDFISKNNGWCRAYQRKYMIGKPGAKKADEKLFK